MAELQGRVAVVTGGSGAIGAAICRVFVREGARVAFTYRESVAKAKALEAELGGAARAYPLDVTDSAAIDVMTKAVVAEWGTIDVLVNNAAIAQILALPLLDEEDWDALSAVNLKGPFLVTRSVVRTMVSRKQGSIVNLGSLAGERIMEVPPHYAATKAGMGGLTRSLAWELKRYNIRVNCVVPGLIEGGVGSNVPDKQRKQYEQYATIGRLGRPEEVAEVVCFVASSRASYLNGQMVHVDGGI